LHRAIGKAHRQTRQYADPWSNLADVCWNGGNPEAAIDGYLHAIAIKKDYPEAWTRLSKICLSCPDLGMRGDVLTELQDLDPIRSESFARRVLPA
jgi:hypothetical protein